MSVTKIEWTERTWNPVRGCIKISPGCKNCYAETFAERWRGVAGHPYEQGFDLRLVPEKLTEPFRWREPQRIFVNSMSDLFQDGIPDEYIAETFGVMAVAAQQFWSGRKTLRVGTRTFQGKSEAIMSYGELYGPHVFQILTKRPEIMRALLSSRKFQIEVSQHAYKHAMDRVDAGYLMERIRNGRLWPLPNVWLGVSVENQDYLKRIDILKDVPAAVRFVSFEPLLEDLGAVLLDGIHWAIIGGESGPHARPLNIQWIWSLLRQCREQDVIPFVKQLGSNPFLKFEQTIHQETPTMKLHIQQMEIDTTIRLKDRKGGSMEEWPEDLRVREYPR